MSETRIVPATDRACVEEAVRILREGGLVCYPTDTVYGIGAAAGNDDAVRRLFAAKERSPDKALPLLLADASDASGMAEVTSLGRALANQYWPGSLTIVMRKAASYRSLALAGGETAALRVPDHDLVRAIVRALREPLTGTSANRAGAPAPISAQEVATQMGDMVDLVIDGGCFRERVESTVVDITQGTLAILREGPVSREDIEEVAGRVTKHRSSEIR